VQQPIHISPDDLRRRAFDALEEQVGAVPLVPIEMNRSQRDSAS